MIHYIEHHGVECIAIYFVLMAIFSTMPDLPPTATYWQKWLYAIAKALCADMKQAAKQFAPQLQQSIEQSSVIRESKTVDTTTTINQPKEDK